MTNERYLPERIIINGGSRPNQGALEKRAGVKVYKYMSSNEYLPNIISGELYFSKSADFNDILDVKIQLDEKDIDNLELDSPLSEYKRRWNYPNEIKGNRPLTWKDLIYEYNNSSGILCLSELDPCSTQSHHMWGLYGGRGKGFVAAYNLIDIIEKLNSEVDMDDSNTITLQNGFNCITEFVIEAQSVKYESNWDPISNMKKCYFPNHGGKNKQYALYYMTKDCVWENEKELRIVASPQYSSLGCSMTEKMSQGHYKFNRQVKPTDIYFGWNHDPEPEHKNLNYDKIKLHKIKTNIDYQNKQFNFLPVTVERGLDFE